MVLPTLAHAREQAQANADYFRREYVVFTDTAGNIRVERAELYPQALHGSKEVLDVQGLELFAPAVPAPDELMAEPIPTDDGKGGLPISADPADHDGLRPSCSSCTDEYATVRTVVGGHLFCAECFQEWLHGRFDQPHPTEAG